MRAGLAVLCLQAALLAPATAGELLTLDSHPGPVSMVASLETWRDAGGRTSVEQVEAGALTLEFKPLHIGEPQVLDDAALWLRFDAVSQDPRHRWKLELPMSGVDKISLYYRDAVAQPRTGAIHPLLRAYPARTCALLGDSARGRRRATHRDATA
jgi:hypothetical protein